jgi:hypothetical protein
MTKRSVLLAGLVAVVAALGGVGVAYAQTGTPAAPLAQGMAWQAGGIGLLHDYMVQAFADALGLRPDELEARLADGETMSAIALAEGLSLEEFQSLWAETREQALAAAVEDGVLTREQADWMLQHARGRGPNASCLGLGGSGPDGSAAQRGTGRGFSRGPSFAR